MIDGWKYYNHAAVPSTAPHLEVNIEPIRNGSVWRINRKKPLFARWTSNFDIGKETQWWFIICDRPFDISLLNSKKRNVVNNGIKNCYVKVLNPLEHEYDLFCLYNEAQSSYSSKNQQFVSKSFFHNYLLSIVNNPSAFFYCCFLKDNDYLVGYSVVVEGDGFCELKSQKSRPSFEKYQVNAALVYSIMKAYEEKLKEKYYICDGARNINHETHFQDYLEKYFGFRKAYCYLHIKYRFPFSTIIKILYPIRKVIKKFSGNKLFHQIYAVLTMEEIVRIEDKKSE